MIVHRAGGVATLASRFLSLCVTLAFRSVSCLAAEAWVVRVWPCCRYLAFVFVSLPPFISPSATSVRSPSFRFPSHLRLRLRFRKRVCTSPTRQSA